MRLNCGCGDHYADGWVNTDLHGHLDNGPRPDEICSIMELPFESGSCARVYCGHVLEHVPISDLTAALAEVHRVLKADGELLIVGPDVNLTAVHEPVLLPGVMHGGKRWPGDEHHWRSTGETTLAFVVQRFDAHLIALDAIDAGWPVVDRAARWQFAIAASPILED